MTYRAAILIFVLTLLVTKRLLARGADQPSANQVDDTIAPGTTITMRNWQNFKQYMPDGMVAMFQRKSVSKMPDDVAMEIGPPVNYPLPKSYLEAAD